MRNDAHEEDVRRALHRAALLYRHFAETLDRELGREKALELIKKAIWAYGTAVGEAAKERTGAKGLPLTPENFSDDLPSVGWVSRPTTVDGEAVTEITTCAFAEEWRDMDPQLARLYCFVDQSKTEAYNPEYTCVHLMNRLDGDAFCRLAVRKKRPVPR